MMGLHDVLAQRFFAHQQALLDRDFARAAAHLAAYREGLLAHMHDEENVVLPAYRECGGDATNAPLRLFFGEHANMREFVADFAQRTAALTRTPDDRTLLDLLDREATYKNLVLHHDLRERNALYPFLLQRLDGAAQARLGARIHWCGD